MGIELVLEAARGRSEARAVLAQVRKGDVDGILAPAYVAADIPGLSLEAALREGIPTMFSGGGFWTERGALVSYGPDFQETGRQAARLVHKILNGARAGEIPVERNSKVELILNLRTAAALGITIPSSLLARADRFVD